MFRVPRDSHQPERPRGRLGWLPLAVLGPHHESPSPRAPQEPREPGPAGVGEERDP